MIGASLSAALRTSAGARLAGRAAADLAGRKIAISMIISAIAAARISPGTMPARNRSPTDSSAMKP